MTTVLAVYTKNRCVGRCDATCYKAKNRKCTCICGGRNHGVGFKCAEANVKQMVGLTVDDLTEYAHATKRNPRDLYVVNRLDLPNVKQARRHARSRLAEPDLFEERPR